MLPATAPLIFGAISAKIATAINIAVAHRLLLHLLVAEYEHTAMVCSDILRHMY